MDFMSDGINLEDFTFENIKGSSIDDLRKEISIKELTKVFEVPKDWILLERTLLLLMGVTNKIAPEYSPLETIKPYLKNLVLKDGGIKNIILNILKRQVTTLVSLPNKMDKYLSKANNGELEFELKHFEKHTKKLYAVGQQILFGLGGIISLGLAFISRVYKIESYENLFVYIAGALASLCLFSIWRNRYRLKG